MSTNSFTEISLTNFKPFKRRQVVPLKPITLIYGPNSSGKSSILDAIQWISSLSDGSGINQFPRFAYRHDETQPIELTYKMKCYSHHLGEALQYDSPASTAYSIFYDVQSLEIKTVIGRCSGIFFSPSILKAETGLNDLPFVAAEYAVRLDRIGSPQSYLRLTSLNKSHPVMAKIAEWTIHDAPQHLSKKIDRLRKACVEVNPEAAIECDLQGCLLREEAVLEALSRMSPTILLESIDIEECPLRFELDQTPLMPVKTSTIGDIHAHWYFSDETAEEKVRLSGSLRENPDESARELLLTLFWERLAEAIGLINDPCEMTSGGTSIQSDVHRVPRIRPCPKSGFLLTDDDALTANAPGWPRSTAEPRAERTANQIDRMNEWLKYQNRPDANYELLYSKVEISECTGDKANRSEHIKYKGVRDLGRGVDVEIEDLGSGFSQLLPVLFCAFSDDSICMVEQPELHLHPALQSELADLFILEGGRAKETGDETGSMNQFIIETHSEHLLLRIMRRIRETSAGNLPDGLPAIRPEDVGILYVENRGDHSVVLEMKLNEQGELIRDWPGGFFEEGLREVLL